MSEPLIYEIGRRDEAVRCCRNVMCRKHRCPTELLRSELDLPEVSELQVIRHFTRSEPSQLLD